MSKYFSTISGWPRFGSVAVWGWNGSSGSGFRFRRFLCKKGFLYFSTVQQERTVPVSVSVPGKRFRRFRFRFWFREKRFRRFRFPVPVRLLSLSHPAIFVRHQFSGPFPVLPFLAFSVLPRKNLKFTKDFLSLPNPQNPWKRQRKYQDSQGYSLLKINQGNPLKTPRNGRTGFGKPQFWPNWTQQPVACELQHMCTRNHIKHGVRTRSTTTRDRNLQFRDASPLDCLVFSSGFLSRFSRFTC